MRCAAIHRKLGTHISKVKSLSMDSWSNEQVENMRKVGNIASNKNYNPQNKRPSMPVDIDEADGAMERFIRQKYMNRAFGSTKTHNTGSTESDETPPPLPPKTPSRFGFRSASSIFPLGSKAKAQANSQPPPSPLDLASQNSPRWNKPAQVFGASVQEVDSQSMESKLAKLRDMGFTDDQRNAIVLKGVGGNLEKAIEALVRLGEGERRSPNPVASREQPTNRSLTPATTSSARDARARPISPASNNPFDMLDTPQPPQPLSSQSTGTLQNRNPYLSSSPNPYAMPSQQAPGSLDLAFQNMSLAPPSQPLFPNHTGGVAGPQQMSAHAIYQQQPMTAPIPSMGQNYSPMGFQHSQTYPIPAQPTGNSYNPFMNQQVQVQPQQPLTVNTAAYPNNFGNNPFTRSPTRIQSPGLAQIPEQTQQNFYQPAAQPAAVASPQLNNPFFNQGMGMPQQQQQQQQQQYPVQMPQQQQMGYAQQLPGQYQQNPYQQPQRPDKASIMALYNYPQLAPAPFQSQDANQTAQQPDNSATAAVPTAAVPGSKNPFMSAGNGAASAPAAQQSLVDISMPKQYNASRESVMALGLEWSNGRHSPDAFASLSARDTR
ncbi:putative GTPase activating protein for Arf-domain-containing protein [Immersiella caudata]|uniref:GTPase activating protein for Arf-domain-containing protein n=1 Tax=Immersiella caudata TaxID=314043 RepID=A0AA40BUM4_9PEZI|nr:putative GTPase activating protein for Arf-domain-containing protein [Immersiella caudata]